MIIFLLKKKILLFALCLTVFISGMGVVEVYGDESLSMYSRSFALTDARTNRVLRGKATTEPMANASTTKILTCIVALENANLSDEVQISKNAAAQPKVRLGVKAGEVYLLEDLLYGLMLESYNDCAVAIAEHIGGTVENFAKLMNEKAKLIGCKDTYFITPNGLDAEDDISFHHTTAEDLCKIMAYCVWESSERENFIKITQTRNYKSYVNRNTFLDQMAGVVSGKTGFTSKAGYCYVAAFEKDGERYCIALLACGWPNNKTYKWKDAKTLLNYGQESYDLLQQKEECIEEKLLVSGCVGDINFSKMHCDMLLMVEGVSSPFELLISQEEKVQKEIIIYTDTSLPIEQGQVLGQCNYYIEDMLLLTVPLVAKEKVSQWNFKEVLSVILVQFLSFSSQTS